MAECVIVGNGGSDNIDQLILLDETVDGYKTINNTVKFPFVYFCTYGKSIQNDIPTPDAPIPIEGIGDDGTVTITVDNGNDITLSATITSGLPLYEANDIYDELIYTADGTGKIIKRTGKKRIVADSTLHHNWQSGAWGITNFFADGVEIADFVTTAKYYCNYAPFNRGADSVVSTAGVIGVAQGGGKNLYFRFNSAHTSYSTITDYLNNNEIYVIYELATPIEIELSADEMAEILKLQTFNDITNIRNDENAKMRVKIAALTGD